MQTIQPTQDQQLQSSQPNPSDGALPPSQYLPVYYGGLESILESERSSQDNIRASQERRPEFQFQAPSLQVSQRDRSESERSAGAYEALLRKFSILESELVKERAKTQVLSKDNYTKRQETEEKKMLHEDLSVVSARMEDLEDKLTQITTENQRLRILINTQKLTISELQSKNKLSCGQATVAGTTTTTTAAIKANSAQTYSEDNSRIREQASEQMRVFWKEHFERVQATMIERYESEKKQLIIQLNVKEQLNQQLQASFDDHTNYVVEKSQMVSQIEQQAHLIDDLEYLLQDERQASANFQQELKDREVEITQVQICLNELEMKLMELKSVNDHQSEQLTRLNQIELEAGNVLQENTRLSNEIQELSEQREQSIKEIEKEKQQQEIDQKVQNTQQQALLNIEKENISHVYEQWKYSESALTKELEEFKVLTKEMKEQINSIEQQITILEDDKEKLLVILAKKSDLEHDCEVLNEKNTQLELEVTQLLQSNSFLNGNLNSRLKEVGMWKDRHEQSVDECRRVSQEYQEHISKQIEEHARELQQEKMKKSISIEKMTEELNSVQSKLLQFQFESTSKHAVEIEKQRILVSKLHEKLSSSQREVVSLQQCLIELEHHHSRKTRELSEQFSGKINKLLEEHMKKMDDIQANRAMLKVQLQQAELQNSQLHSALLVQQQGHQEVISRIMEEREGNSRGFGSSEGVELIEQGQQLNTPGEILPEILKNNLGTYNGSYYSAPENLESGSNSSPYFPQLFQRSSASGQQSSSSSCPLFPRKAPLGNYRSSLKEQGSQDQNKLDESLSGSPQENSLQREIKSLEAHELAQKKLMKVLAAQNTELKSGLRDLERQYYANSDGRLDTQAKNDDRNRQSSGQGENEQRRTEEISGSRGVKEDLEKREQEENHGDDQNEEGHDREQYPQETQGKKDFERREETTFKSVGKKQDQEKRTNNRDLNEEDLSSHGHGENDLENQLGFEEEQEDPNSNGDRYEHGEDYGEEEHGDGTDHEEQFEDDEEWDKDF